MKYGLHKMTWGEYFDPGNMEQFFADAKAAGAETIEFRLPQKAIDMDQAEIRHIRGLAEQYELEMMYSFAYPDNADMRSADPDERKRAVELLRRGIYAAREMGGREIGGVLYSGWPTKFENDMLTRQERYERCQRSLECMSQVVPAAEECGIPLNLEILNRYENYVINTVEQGIDFCKQIGSDHCKLLLDVYHMNIEEDDICQAIRSAKGYIGHFHVSEPNRGIPYHSNRIDWRAIGEALRSTGYDGTVTIEAVVSFDGPSTYYMRMWRDLMEDGSKPARIEAMRAGLRYIKEQFEA